MGVVLVTAVHAVHAAIIAENYKSRYAVNINLQSNKDRILRSGVLHTLSVN